MYGPSKYFNWFNVAKGDSTQRERENFIYLSTTCTQLTKIASEMPVPHSLRKYFQHHEIQKYCISINFRILSEHCQLYIGPNNV